VNFEGLNLVRRSEFPKAEGGDFDRVSGARRASILGELDLGRPTLLVTITRRSCVEAETFLDPSAVAAATAISCLVIVASSGSDGIVIFSCGSGIVIVRRARRPCAGSLSPPGWMSSPTSRCLRMGE
jgi:hypothetical protein